jgi:hypothetical protein
MPSSENNKSQPVGLKIIFRSFQYRNYRLFFSGQSISLIGTWIQRIATPWLVYWFRTDKIYYPVTRFGQFNGNALYYTYACFC